ncbi:MAG: hypothetical protein M0P18_10340 [Syntrophales bacterium]|nr:hypothetical protein [Syntrophales bacterium]
MEFCDLFKGLSDAFGRYVVKSNREKGGKITGQAWTEKGPVTRELYDLHLKGKQGLGICPITRGNVCYWGAIDIDKYDIDLIKLEQDVKKLKLPFVLCRTKSGGAHLYLFIKGEPVPAIILRDKLLEFATALGFPHSEIFPKQTSLNENDLGNWINLPYFNHGTTTRYALENGKAVDLQRFLQLCEETAVDEKELAKIKPPLLEEFSDAPPCLQYLAAIGVQKGQKDAALFNFAVYCKMKYGEEWEARLEEINHKYVHPPALARTVQKVIKPHRKKDYFYTCSQSPLSQYCNKDTCKLRTFGIGKGGGPQIMIGALTKINASPPVWYLNIEGVRVEMVTEDLLSQNRFRKRCLETIHKIPPRMDENQWDALMQEKLDNVEIIEAPEDAGPLGQFLYLLREFCNLYPATDKSEILRQKPWTEGGKTYFQSPALIAFLNKNRFNYFSTSQLYASIRDLGGEPKSMNIKGKTIRVWVIPEFDKQQEPYDVPKIEKDPF